MKCPYIQWWAKHLLLLATDVRGRQLRGHWLGVFLRQQVAPRACNDCQHRCDYDESKRRHHSQAFPFAVSDHGRECDNGMQRFDGPRYCSNKDKDTLTKCV